MSTPFVSSSIAAQATQPASAATISATPSPTQTPPKDSALGSIGLLALFIVALYFLTIRPHSKRMKAQQQLLASLQVGDEVATTGGLLGRVKRLDDTIVFLAVSDQTVLRFQRSAVTGVLPRGTLSF